MNYPTHGLSSGIVSAPMGPLDVPREVEGQRVVEYARLQSSLLPVGYVAPTDGRPPLAPVDLFVIAISEGIDGDPIYWVHCLDASRRPVTHGMFFTLEAARRLPAVEYGVANAEWLPM